MGHDIVSDNCMLVQTRRIPAQQGDMFQFDVNVVQPFVKGIAHPFGKNYREHDWETVPVEGTSRHRIIVSPDSHTTSHRTPLRDIASRFDNDHCERNGHPNNSS